MILPSFASHLFRGIVASTAASLATGFAAAGELPASPPAPVFKLAAPATYFDNAADRALLEAALAGDLARARDAVAHGASPEAEGSRDNPYNHLRLLHYAIAADSEPAIRTLISVGASPESVALGSAGLPLLFAETLDRPELLSLMLDLRPVGSLAPRTLEIMMSHAVMEDRPRCLAVLLQHGVPIDIPDDAGGTILTSAIDAQDYDLARWLIEQGASVTIDAHDVSMAWTIEFHLRKYVPGSPTYAKVLLLQQMAQARGAQFPAKSPKQRRAERKAAAASDAASASASAP